MPYLTSDLLTSDEPIELTECPRSRMIVGGGYIALELGQMFRRFGAEVSILERDKQLLAHGYELDRHLVQLCRLARWLVHQVSLSCAMGSDHEAIADARLGHQVSRVAGVGFELAAQLVGIDAQIVGLTAV